MSNPYRAFSIVVLRSSCDETQCLVFQPFRDLPMPPAYFSPADAIGNPSSVVAKEIDPEGKNSIITLLKTASVMGNGQMQFNCVDNVTLMDAQIHPEQHRDLIVRVAGYCAFFVELCKEVQDEIISRTVLG